jgi:hypothetical protein
LKTSLTDWSADVAVPGDLATGSLRRQRKRHVRARIATTVAVFSTVAALVVPLAVLGAGTPTGTSGPAGPGTGAPKSTTTPSVKHYPAPPGWTQLRLSGPHSGNTALSAHPGQVPPTDLIAAGSLAISAYQVGDRWYLLNTSTARYVATDWRVVAPEPGLGLAAVLIATADTRIQILDLATQQVVRSIDLPGQVAAMSWSPDGKSLAATSRGIYQFGGDPRRTGYWLIDMTSGAMDYVTMPDQHAPDAVPDAAPAWLDHGQQIQIQSYGDWGEDYTYSLGGKLLSIGPKKTGGYTEVNPFAVSPDGTLKLTTTATKTTVRRISDGAVVGRLQYEGLFGWASNNTLLVRVCEPGCKNEFHNRMAVMSVDGRTITPLTALARSKNGAGSADDWYPIVTAR